MLPGHKKIINISNITEVGKIGQCSRCGGKKLYFMLIYRKSNQNTI